MLQNGSQGMIDSLSTLTGIHPGFSQLASSQAQVAQVNGNPVQLAGHISADEKGRPVIGLTPATIDNFFTSKSSGYERDYTPVPAKLGDAVISHEFGHLAALGPLSDALFKIDPNADSSEKFADHFQNAFQFLRGQSTDTKQLDSTTQKIVDVILASPLYENHPINQARARDAQLKYLAGKPPT
jgi:hypothetical protein